MERIGSGIPAAQQSVRDAGMDPLEFDDRGVRFTVVMRTRDDRTGGWAGATPAMEQVVKQLSSGPATIAQLVRKTGYTSAQVRYMIGKLVDVGEVIREPLDGRTSVYRRA